MNSPTPTGRPSPEPRAPADAMPRLVGDIGGTNARFALCGPDGQVREERKLPVADHPGLIEAAEAYLAGRKVRDAVFAVATPVLGDTVAFTNSAWRFSIRAARERLGLRDLAVINDFVAQATAIPALGGEDLRALKPGEAKAGRPRLVIGPGTGLGVAFLLPDGPASGGQGWRVAPSEAGHASFAPQDALQAELLRRLREIHGGHVSAERLVSGPGLLQTARSLAEIRGAAIRYETPRDVSDRAAAGDCPTSAEAVRLFCFLLGSVAGNYALTLLTEGGVHVTGGLCRNLGPLLDREELIRGFTAKGRFSGYLETIPIGQVLRPHTGLLGAALHRHV